MREYRVTARRIIDHEAIVEAASIEEAKERYLASDWIWDDEERLECEEEDIVKVEVE